MGSISSLYFLYLVSVTVAMQEDQAYPKCCKDNSVPCICQNNLFAFLKTVVNKTKTPPFGSKCWRQSNCGKLCLKGQFSSLKEQQQCCFWHTCPEE